MAKKASKKKTTKARPKKPASQDKRKRKATPKKNPMTAKRKKPAKPTHDLTEDELTALRKLDREQPMVVRRLGGDNDLMNALERKHMALGAGKPDDNEQHWYMTVGGSRLLKELG